MQKHICVFISLKKIPNLNIALIVRKKKKRKMSSCCYLYLAFVLITKNGPITDYLPKMWPANGEFTSLLKVLLGCVIRPHSTTSLMENSFFFRF